MAKVEIKLNIAGLRELRRSKEVQALLEEQANAALRRLGNGYESSTHVGKGRANVSIAATSEEAIRENEQNNTVLKALR